MAVENLRIYNDARVASKEVYDVVKEWDDFNKNTLGTQLVRAIDSVCSNISEGYGRSATGERLQFMFYADGSLQEAKTQLRLAADRGLMDATLSKDLVFLLKRLSIAIIEFCHVMLERDETYQGGYRKRVEDRRKWRTQPTTDDNNDPD
jgi:four helix bundle protein